MMMKLTKYFTSVLFAIITPYFLQAQSFDTTATQKSRLKPLVITSSAAYLGSMVALNQLWYADHDREHFHFFDDSHEWKQLDKAGHFYSAFHISSGSYEALQWSGMEEKKSLWYGTLTSAVVLTSIEIFDGFSSAYGASLTDIAANTTGAAFFMGQQALWKDIRLHPKFSFRTTNYASQRPEVLGSNFSEQLLKDYNGQTYWLSADISKFIKRGKFPKWLNIAFGYGANGMVYAEDNANVSAGYSPTRQYYIALDLDLNEYKTNSAFLNTLIYIINMVHLPSPALEWSNGELKLHYAY